MKLNTLSLAVCAAIGVMAAPAFAATPVYNAANAREFYTGGASAQNGTNIQLGRTLCAGGSMTLYQVTVGTNANNIFATLCTPGSITLTGGKTQMVIHKNSVGGSGNGVAPVANGTAVQYIDLSLATIAPGVCSTSSSPAFSGGALPNYTQVNCAESAVVTTVHAPKVGFSDVEPAFFDSAADTTFQNDGQVKSVSALIFGVPVSKKMRDKLQAYQNPSCVGFDTEACMPSLSEAQLRSIYTGNATTWSSLGYPANVAVGASTDILSDTIYVARRVNSSGTQKAFEIFAAHSPAVLGSLKSCAVDTDTFVTAGATDANGDVPAACTTGGPLKRVFSGSGSSNVRNCLIAHDGQNRGAVGILTSEEKHGTNAWRFIAVNGYAPTLKNTANGVYTLYTEISMQYLNDTYDNVDDHGTFIDLALSTLTDPVTVNTVNTGFVQASPADWQGGVLALASSQATIPAPAFPYTNAGILANPVLSLSKLTGGSVLNNCQEAKVLVP